MKVKIWNISPSETWEKITGKINWFQEYVISWDGCGISGMWRRTHQKIAHRLFSEVLQALAEVDQQSVVEPGLRVIIIVIVALMKIIAVLNQPIPGFFNYHIDVNVDCWAPNKLHHLGPVLHQLTREPSSQWSSWSPWWWWYDYPKSYHVDAKL